MARCEITALALDMDGTLLTSDKRVTADTLATLRALLARGMSIFAVTGKAPRITARCLAPLHLPMVCLDGAVHVTGGVQRWVDGTTIDDRLAARLLHDCGGPCYVLAGGATQVRGAVHRALPGAAALADGVPGRRRARDRRRATVGGRNHH